VSDDFIRDAMRRKRAADARNAKAAGLPVVDERRGGDDHDREQPVADLAPGVRQLVPLERGASEVDEAIRREADRLRGRDW
jgi:hypothetical protein